ncbi:MULTISPECIES: hypothetical protein [Actinomycetes]|nr:MULTISPECIES: hypothetical protein [Actinomycetes]
MSFGGSGSTVSEWPSPFITVVAPGGSSPPVSYQCGERADHCR